MTFRPHISRVHQIQTSYPEAVEHFENVAKASAQLIAVLGGGHMPSGQISEMASSAQQKTIRELFRKFLLGERVSEKNITSFNSGGSFKIKLARTK